ncbi:MAG: NADH-dependent [FeFe] hydrogenase, group A6 [Brevinematia bacterium]
MAKYNIKVNGFDLKIDEDMTILQAAKLAQINIPKLCNHPDLPPSAACGLCVVKVKGSNKLMRACATKIENGMEITTHDPELFEVRKTVLELILSTHPNDCLKCPRNGNCELQQLAADFGIRDVDFPQLLSERPVDDSTKSLVVNPEKCIKCGRCVEVCQIMQNVWAIEFLERGFNMRIAPAADVQLKDSPCVKCGQCTAHCPVGALYEHSHNTEVWTALKNPELHKIVQIAPAVRVALGEAFGLEPGTVLTGKIYTVLKRLGFDAVFDTNFGADLTIMEEGSEFIERFVHGKGELPLITSCCPGWVDYMEKYYPEMIPHFSSAKSPHEMVGALSKTYYAEKKGIDPSKIFGVSIMPCTAKKYEITRIDDMFASGYQDIDVVLTTREFSRMIKASGIDFLNLPDSEPDNILGEYTGAGVIFGATGGVMEAALRTAYYLITGKNLGKVDIEETRGLEGIKTGKININGKEVRIAVAHGLANVATVLDEVKEAKAKGKEMPYHFIEVMACRGGCVGGGGQPYGATDEIRMKRAKGIYTDDKNQEYRCSHENPFIKKLYDEYLGKPLSEKSHKLLHTHYKPRPLYNR